MELNAHLPMLPVTSMTSVALCGLVSCISWLRAGEASWYACRQTRDDRFSDPLLQLIRVCRQQTCCLQTSTQSTRSSAETALLNIAQPPHALLHITP